VKTTETEIDRLATLRAQYTEKQASTVRLKSACQRISHEIGQARVAHLIDPDNCKPKETEARLRRLEAEFKTAEAELSPLGTECAALAGAIEQMESEILPKQHAESLARQAEMQGKYNAVCLRLLEAANALAAASAEARSIYEECGAAYPNDALMNSQAPVLRFAGLSPVWDYEWVNYGNPTKRDYLAGQVWDYNRNLVHPSDPAAMQKLHQENHHKQWTAELEAERLHRNTQRAVEKAAAPRLRSLTERNSGAIVDESEVSVRVRA
jgi:hypothetical protein